MKRLVTSVLALLGAVGVLAGCASDADVASRNLSQAAEQFEIDRRVLFINGITDEYLLEITGRCSIEDQSGGEFDQQQLEVTCKTGEGQYTKNFLGLSDNVTYVVQQLGPAPVDVYRYVVNFRPTQGIPSIDTSIPGSGPGTTMDPNEEEEEEGREYP